MIWKKRSSSSHHVPSPHEHLLHEVKWEYVDCGSRRNCYKLGDSGFCVKFYKAPEECVEGKMKRSIRREIASRRMSESCNACSREVQFYDAMRKTLPEAVRNALPEVCERVYDPTLGWGVLETYYTNPDGTAIIPYEFEIARQRSEANKTEIYRQAKAMLDALISCSATFYEPGNFHTLIRPDGGIETKIVDFEVEAKTLIPLEAIWPWFRRQKLARKAGRYLKHIRDAYGVHITI